METGGFYAAKETLASNSSYPDLFYNKIFHELKFIERISYPNTVSYYGLQVYTDRISVILEYCSDPNLRKYIEEGHSLSVE